MLRKYLNTETSHLFFLACYLSTVSLYIFSSERYGMPQQKPKNKEQHMLCITEEENAPKTKTGSLVPTGDKGLALNGSRSFQLGVPKLQITPSSKAETPKSAAVIENTQADDALQVFAHSQAAQRPRTPSDIHGTSHKSDNTNVLDYTAAKLINECHYKTDEVKSKIYYLQNQTSTTKNKKKTKLKLNPSNVKEREKLIELTYENYILPEFKRMLRQNCPEFSADEKTVQEEMDKEINQYLKLKETFIPGKNPNKAYFLHNAIVDLWYPTLADECSSCCHAIWCCLACKKIDASKATTVEEIEEQKTSRSTPKVDRSTKSKANSKEKKS